MTLDQTKAAGDPALSRSVTVTVDGLVPGAAYTLSHDRVDEEHSNVAKVWGELRAPDQAWPTDEQWEQLRAADRLDQLEPPRQVTADGEGRVEVAFELPMPSMSFLRLAPVA
jgi:xylan 1,4-beta-xylosidase